MFSFAYVLSLLLLQYHPKCCIFATTIMQKATFQSQFLPFLSDQPGIYKYYNADKKLLYVGKAKNLKKRVSSYFAKVHDNNRLNRMVSQIHHIEWTLTDSEHDAFLLENSLIKHFKPHYNIRLKDDKAYPYIVIKREEFPRVFLTRQYIKDGSEYIGPFTSVAAVQEILKIIKASVPLRTCSLALTPGNIANGKFKACLEYQIGNCKAPCIGLQSEQDYRDSIDYVRQIFRGNLNGILQDLKTEMQEAVQALNFEKAQFVKSKLDLLQQYQSKSTVVNNHLGNLDIASIIIQQGKAYVNFMVVVDGRIIHSKNVEVEVKLDEDERTILSYIVSQLHDAFRSVSKEIVTHIDIETVDPKTLVTHPIAGFKKKLLELSFKNNEYYINEIKKKKALLLEEKTSEDYQAILEQMQKDLGMKVLPDHIECFDNSNFQGSFPVAAMVCFKNGVPSKDDYRRFHIKTVEGINDFASMAEIVKRRYKRLLDDNQPLPKLVIIDGGKGQLGYAMQSIEALGLLGKMTVVGLAKREESIFFPGKSNPLMLPYNGPSLLLIRRIRDEVHRFGITFHRNTRDKGTIKNELEDIKGIGIKTAHSLLQHFRSVKKIKEATIEELQQIIDAKKSKIVFDYFHKMDEENTIEVE